MKKYFRISVLTLAALFVFAACDSSGGGPAVPVDNPQAGEMTAETAQKIFTYHEVSGGIEIAAFKNENNALAAYLGGGNNAPAAGPARAPAAEGTLVLNKIAGIFIVSIAENAFNPSANGGNKLRDSGITQFRLPEKLNALKENSFAGAGLERLLVPETVEVPPETIVAAADSTGAQVAASNGDEPFLGDGIFITKGSLYINVPKIYTEADANVEYTGNSYVKVVNIINFVDQTPDLAYDSDAIQGGEFIISVPTPATGPINFPGVTVSPPDLQLGMLQFYGQDGQREDNFFQVSELGNGEKRRTFFQYADRDGTMNGVYRNNEGTPDTYDNVKIKKGWNVITQDDTANRVCRSEFVDENYKWRFLDPGFGH